MVAPGGLGPSLWSAPLTCRLPPDHAGGRGVHDHLPLRLPRGLQPRLQLRGVHQLCHPAVDRLRQGRHAGRRCARGGGLCHLPVSPWPRVSGQLLSQAQLWGPERAHAGQPRGHGAGCGLWRLCLVGCPVLCWSVVRMGSFSGSWWFSLGGCGPGVRPFRPLLSCPRGALPWLCWAGVSTSPALLAGLVKGKVRGCPWPPALLSGQ